MDSLGIVIFKDGTVKPYGKAVYADQKEYIDNPGHEDSFKKEIITSIDFKLMNLEFNKKNDFYKELVSVVNNGLIVIENRKVVSTDNDSIMAWLPSEVSPEQLTTITELELDKIENKDIYEFLSDDMDDHIKYASFLEYIADKQEYKHGKSA